MKLRQLFEERKKKVVAVMPGGFHPFHPGHKSLYDWAVDTFGKPNVYVAATDDTKSRPFPFSIKQKLAAMAGVPTQRFIQVKSPFNALSYTGLLSDPENTALVFVRSEKDQTSHPKPDQIRKSDGQMGYIISYNGELEHGADMHGYMTYGPTIDFDFSGMSIKSASELRAAWPEMSDEDKLQAAELMYPGNAETATQLLNKALGVTEPADIKGKPKTEDVSPENEKKFHNELDDLVHKYFGDSPDEEKMLKKYRKTKKAAPIGEADQQPAESYIVKPGDTIWAIASRFADSNYDGDVKAGAKDILELNGIKNPKSLRPGQKLEIGYFMGGMSSGATRGLPPGGFKAYEAEVTPGQSLPKQIKVIKMPTPPQAPTGPDGTDENGTRIGTTPKGNRSVASGAGTYIFTPKGKLMLYMTPKIGGLQQTHNIAKQTVTVNFGTSAQGATIDQKATYDMSGKLISGDNTSIRSGNMGASIDKDKGSTVDYKVDANTKVSANSKTGIKVN
jgi:LysM repeat protein